MKDTVRPNVGTGFSLIATPRCSFIGNMDWPAEFAEKSRVKGDLHARFCEEPEVKLLRLTRLDYYSRAVAREFTSGEAGEKK